MLCATHLAVDVHVLVLGLRRLRLLAAHGLVVQAYSSPTRRQLSNANLALEVSTLIQSVAYRVKNQLLGLFSDAMWV